MLLTSDGSLCCEHAAAFVYSRLLSLRWIHFKSINKRNMKVCLYYLSSFLITYNYKSYIFALICTHYQSHPSILWRVSQPGPLNLHLRQHFERICLRADTVPLLMCSGARLPLNHKPPATGKCNATKACRDFYPSVLLSDLQLVYECHSEWLRLFISPRPPDCRPVINQILYKSRTLWQAKLHLWFLIILPLISIVYHTLSGRAG